MLSRTKLLKFIVLSLFATSIRAQARETSEVSVDSTTFTFTLRTSSMVAEDAAGEPVAVYDKDGKIKSLNFRVPFVKIIDSNGEVVSKSLLNSTNTDIINEETSKGFCALYNMDWVKPLEEYAKSSFSIAAFEGVFPEKSKEEIMEYISHEYPNLIELGSKSSIRANFKGDTGSILTGTTCAPREIKLKSY